MPIIAFSYEKQVDNPNPATPDILLDAHVVDMNNSQHVSVMRENLKDRSSVLVSSSKEPVFERFAKDIGMDIDDIKAHKVDLNDLHRALQLGGSVHADPAETFYQRDVDTAYARGEFAKDTHQKLSSYDLRQHEGLDDRRKQIIAESKAHLLSQSENLSNRAKRSSEILADMKDSHVHKVKHAFDRMQQVTTPTSFSEHVIMINLSNEAQYGKQLFEFDYTQAQDVMHTLYSKVNERTASIAEKYLGMKDGEIKPENRTEFSELALQKFPDLLNFGFESAPEVAFKQLSSSETMAELFRTKMPDGTNLVNPAWFNDLRQAGVQYDIRDTHKDKSVTGRHLLNTQKPLGMNPKDAMRFDFVVDMLNARREFIAYDRNKKDIDKILEVANDHDDKVPLATTYAGAISKRYTSGGDYSLNSLGLQSYAKSVLKAPNEGQIIDIDYSQAEMAMAAALLNNQALLQAYNNRSDIYLALGVQADQVTKGNPLAWQDLMAQTEYLQKNTPDEVKADKNSDYHRMRSSGKMVAIPAIYGSGAEKLAESQGITEKQADVLLTAFGHVFPEIKQTQKLLDDYLRQALTDPSTPPISFGGSDGKMVTINANDKEFVNGHSVPNPHAEFTQNAPVPHTWLLERAGVQGASWEPVNSKNALTVTLSSGEKMVYDNPYIENNGRRTEVMYMKNGESKKLYGSSLLQNITQFAAFSAIREMTVRAAQTLENRGVEAKFLLNIHDENAFVAKDKENADKAIAVLQSGVISKSNLAPQLDMAFSLDVGKHLDEVKNLKKYEPKTKEVDLRSEYEIKQEYDATALQQSLSIDLDLDSLSLNDNSLDLEVKQQAPQHTLNVQQMPHANTLQHNNELGP